MYDVIYDPLWFVFQRRLIARKEDLVDRELSLQEKDKLLSELRQNLARQPGVDIIDEAR